MGVEMYIVYIDVVSVSYRLQLFYNDIADDEEDGRIEDDDDIVMIES
jgi:hypothetical protein